MKLDVARQPLLAAFVTLLVLVTAGVVRSGYGLPLVESSGEAASLLGDWLLRFEERWPWTGRLISGILLFLSGVSLGRVTVRYGLYSVRTYLAIPLFGLFACGVFMGSDYTVASFAAALLLLSVRNFYAGFRNGYSFTAIFRASLYLGTIPLIYTPAIVLLLLLPAAVFLFKRSAREVCTASFGLFLPFLTYSYVTWGMGESIAAPAIRLWTAFLAFGGFSVPQLPLPVLILLGTSLLATLGAAVCYFRDLYAVGLKPRAILLFNLILFVLCAALFFVPSGTAASAALAAVPVATLVPVLLVRITPPVAMCLYLGLIGLCAASLLL